METLELFRRLYVAGVVVSLTADGKLKLAGCQVPDDQRIALRAAKPEIIAALIAQGIGAIDRGYCRPRQYAVPPDCIAGNACRHLGPCSDFLMCRPCNPEESPDYGKAV